MDSIMGMRELQTAQFERAVLPYMDHLYCAALLMTNDLDDADDLVLSTFARAHESFHQVQGGTDVKAWLYHAFSSAFAEITEWRRPELQPGAADSPRHLQPADAEPSIPFGLGPTDSDALNQLPDSEIKRALQELPAHLRLAVYLADVEGYTYAEMADIVEAPIPTVATRLHQGRRRFRALLLRQANAAGAVRLQRR